MVPDDLLIQNSSFKIPANRVAKLDILAENLAGQADRFCNSTQFTLLL
jgi:hypothetical protein